MRVIPAAALETALDYRSLVDRLRDYFRSGCTVPVRHRHTLPSPLGGEGGGEGAHDATLLLMPAWRDGGYIGVKIATVFPDNGAQGLPAVMASYLLMSGKTGAPLALIDGTELTVRRTAAASALASRYLSRSDSERLLMVGTGKLAPHLILAHASQRPICNVLVWGRDVKKAKALAKRLDRPDFRVAATEDLESAARGAHVISCATLSRDPLIRGEWLQPGQHLDLVGAFTPAMRESDDAAVRRARVFVDTREGALKEAGDITQALASGALSEDAVRGDLFDLTRGAVSGRDHYRDITLFKSVGTALEDLAAAKMAFERS
ncbi:MAG: ornithine cyclodeaminase family protein [Rhodobacterales bacterium]|nr:ornithine cyclodeaminase family protein [Rhodobacterales bacterium]